MYNSEYDFIEEKNGLKRVTKLISNNTKWGLLNQHGDLILPVKYDYIAIPVHDHSFIFYEGNFEWEEYDETSSELFYDCINNPNSWNGDYEEASITNRRWD